MQFSLIVAVLAALVFSDNPLPEPLTLATLRLILAGIGMAGVALAAAFGAGITSQGLLHRPEGKARLLRRYDRWRKWHVILWLMMIVAIVHGLQWGRLVRVNWGWNQSFLVDELLILIPVLVPLFLSWLAFYEVEKTLRGISDQAEDLPPLPNRWAFVGLQVRTNLGVLLLPLFGFFALQDLTGFTDALENEGGFLSWGIFGTLLGSMILGLPLLLRFMWRAEPLPQGALRDRLIQAGNRWGFRASEILVWKTDGTMINAAVAGIVPQLRYVFLSDGLLANFSDEEIEAVFGHEVGHIKHRHIIFRAAVMLAPVVAAFACLRLFPALSEALSRWCQMVNIQGEQQVGVFVLLGMTLYGLTVFAWFSRRFEYQADLFGSGLPEGRVEDASRMVLQAPYNGTTMDMPLVTTGSADSGDHRVSRCMAHHFTQALEKLALLNGIDRSEKSWQHGSVADRVGFIEQMSRDPSLVTRYHRHLRLWDWILLSLIGVSVLALVWLQ